MRVSSANRVNRYLNSNGMARVLIPICTLALVGYLAWRPSPFFVALPLLLAGGWLLLRHPPLGPIALVLSAMVIPFAIGTGTQTSLNMAFLMVPALGVIWFVGMYRRRSFALVPSRTTLPLIGLVLAITLSLLSGYLLWNPFAHLASIRAQIGGWGIFAFSALTFLLTANQIKEVRWLKRLVWVFLALTAVFLIPWYLPATGFVSRLFPEGVNGSLFWIWTVTLAFGQALFNRDLNRTTRISLIVLVALALGVGILRTRSWASGWLPGLLAIGLLTWFRWPRAGLAMGVLAAAVGSVAFPTIERLVLTTDNQYSLITRQAAFEIVIQIIKANPLLGVGPANYYYYTPLYSILGWYVEFNSHNQYIDIVAQTGLLGLGFFAWFVFEVARLGWRLRNRFEDGFARAYVYSCLAGLAGTLVAGMLGDWFLPFVYNIGIAGFRASVLGWLFLGGLVALEQMARRQPTSQPT